MTPPQTRCPNFNHGRDNAPVRFCPMCGDVVNASRALVKCPEEVHVRRRKQRDNFCVGCGIQLLGALPDKRKGCAPR